MNTKLSNEKFVIDKRGKKIGIIISLKHYKKLLEALEEIESIKIYDKTQKIKEDKILIEKAFKEIESDK